jgi:hypothetical protein
MWARVSIALGLVLVVSVSVFYWYFKWSQAELTIIRENNARLEIAVQTNEETIKTLQQDQARAGQIQQETNRQLSETRLQNRQLVDRLSRHEIGVLAEAKPGLVERRINNASEKAARCFELLSGAALTETERGARNAQEFNSECPWLYIDTLGR